MSRARVRPVIPILQRVLAVYGGKIGYAATLAGALSNLSHGPAGVPQVNGTGSTTTPTATATPTSPAAGRSTKPPTSAGPPKHRLCCGNSTTPSVALQDACNDHVNWAKIGTSQAEVRRLTAEYIGLLDSSSASATPRSTPSPTATR